MALAAQRAGLGTSAIDGSGIFTDIGKNLVWPLALPVQQALRQNGHGEWKLCETGPELKALIGFCPLEKARPALPLAGQGVA